MRKTFCFFNEFVKFFFLDTFLHSTRKRRENDDDDDDDDDDKRERERNRYDSKRREHRPKSCGR